MTRIQGDRAPLDELLGGLAGGQRLTDVFLLAGPPGSDAEKVYERASKMHLEAVERVVLIQDTSLLAPSERQAWFDDASERYAVFRVTQKTVHPKGPVSDLLLHGIPNNFVVRAKFEDRPAGGAP